MTMFAWLPARVVDASRDLVNYVTVFLQVFKEEVRAATKALNASSQVEVSQIHCILTCYTIFCNIRQGSIIAFNFQLTKDTLSPFLDPLETKVSQCY